MKINKLKYLTIIIAIVAIITPKGVLAAEGQCNYENYYFFSDIEDTNFTAPANGRNTGTFFPGLKGTNIDPDSKKANMLCLSKTADGDGSDYSQGADCPSEVWDLNKFYTKYLNVLKKGNIENLQININGETSTTQSKIFYEVVAKDNKKVITRYYTHGTWYNINDDNTITKRTGIVDLAKSTVPNLVKASYFPTKTSIPFDTTNNPIEATVKRTISQADLDSVSTANAVKITGSSLCSTLGCRLAPGLVKVSYEADCNTSYKATIDYVVKDANGKETKITFEDGSKNPWKKSGLKDGDSIQEGGVKSPEYKNCEPDTDVVTGEVPSNTTTTGDFYQKVIYTCPGESVGFKATIRYYVKDTKGNEIEVTKENGLYFDKETFGSKYSPYYNDNNGEGLKNGYTETVTSPTIKNCTPDPKSVEVIINNQDFNGKVVYTCSIKNEDTGTTLIYLTWILGAASLGLVAYFFVKNRKESKINE